MIINQRLITKQQFPSPSPPPFTEQSLTKPPLPACMASSKLPEGKTLSNLDEALLPVKIRSQLPGLLDGGFVERTSNVLAFGLPGRGKTHFLAALGRELILRHQISVLFCPTFKLVARLFLKFSGKSLRMQSARQPEK